ncbi:MAG: uroporphyrinogen-III synthase [Planctomycetota bacterium]|nr:MAG: uroporphyrinogen-III synthase [Planctomycetota bacterium]
MTTPEKIWIGREAKAASPYRQAAMEAGWQAEALPLIQTRALETGPKALAQLGNLNRFKWLFFSSAGAVRYWAENIPPNSWPSSWRFAAIGPATAAALEQHGCQVQLQLASGHSLALAEAFLSECSGPTGQASKPSLLWPAAKGGRKEGLHKLQEAGFEVSWLELYESYPLDGPAPPEQEVLLLFSPSGVHSLGLRVQRPERHPVIAFGPSTAEAAHSAGFPVWTTLTTRQPQSLLHWLRTHTRASS